MRNGKTAAAIGAALGMLLLIFDGRTAISGAQEGIDLCIRTLIPSLFPYLVLSSLLTGALMGHSVRLLRPLGRLTGMPEGSESLLALGLLGGYPAGAMNVSLAWHRGQLSKSDADRLLTFCNNAGPAFLFGIIAPMFSEIKTAWLLWGMHILSALIVGIVTADRPSAASPTLSREISLTQSLEQAVRNMAMICGWVVLFRIILCFLERWFLWILPVEIQVLFSGILELSNGCVQLEAVEIEGLRLVIATVLLSFGGICVTMQTASAASGLSMKSYLPAKMLQCCISFLLSIMAQIYFPYSSRWHSPPILSAAFAALMLLLTLYLKRNKKISSIPAICGV